MGLLVIWCRHPALGLLSDSTAIRHIPMNIAHRVRPPVVFQVLVATLVWFAMAAIGGVANGQVAATTRPVVGAVGGVSIDADGVLSNARTDESGELSKMMRQSLEKIPGELNPAVAMRKISLRRLEAALEECANNKKPIPDAIKYLAGLQHIHYVFVYPEQKDIVLVGPGEGWKVDAKGTVVGDVTGRPVMLLDDLLVACARPRTAAKGGITCSIDPTPEGLARIGTCPLYGNRGAVRDQWETALGMQADQRARRARDEPFRPRAGRGRLSHEAIGNELDPSPVRGLPSYLQMVKSTAPIGVSPRFWLEPKYEALLRDADGLAFELRGSGVKAMTEEDFIATTGSVQHSGKAEPIAQMGRHHDRQISRIGRGRSDLRPVAELHGIGDRGGGWW